MTAPDNGSVIYSNQVQNDNFIFGTVATYTCSPGYGLNSTQSRTCITVNDGRTIGRFNGSEPTCDRELVECYLLLLTVITVCPQVSHALLSLMLLMGPLITLVELLHHMTMKQQPLINATKDIGEQVQTI